MTEELKPCPFCGYDDTTVEGIKFMDAPADKLFFKVVCVYCGATGPCFDANAVANWNTRAKLTITDEMVERVADVIGRKRDRHNDGNPNCVGRNYRWLDLEEANEILQAALGGEDG